MKSIHFQGLNCCHDCIISIINHFGLNYPAAFATLWSETDFSYDSYHEVYLTKRMFTNLEALGAKVEYLACHSPQEVDINLSLFDEGEFMIIGMDAFYVPWNQFYQTFHGPHYFIARSAKTETLLCTDPTYNRTNEQIARQDIIAHAFDIYRTTRVAQNPLKIDAGYEAREIMRNHPDTRSLLLARIYGCVNGEQGNIVLLVKYIDAMIRNRYLYRFFLENQSPPHAENHLFFNNDFFSKWQAVKNGLYKASVIRNNESIINDVCNHFNRLMDEEIAMAAMLPLPGKQKTPL